MKRSEALLLALILIAIVSGVVALYRPRVEKWEYWTVSPGSWASGAREGFPSDKFAKLGEDGWEFVAVFQNEHNRPEFIFKRPKTGRPTPNGFDH